MKKLLILLLVCLTLVSSLSPAFASIEEQQQRLKHIEQEKLQKQADINVTDEEMKLNQAGIEEVLIERNRLQKQMEQTGEDIRQQTAELELVQEQLDQAKADVQRRQGEFGERMRVMYINQEQNDVLPLFLKSQSVEEFLTKLDFIKAIVDEDKRIILELKDAQQKVEELEAQIQSRLSELEELQASLEEDRQALRTIERILKGRQEELLARRKELEGEAAVLAATSEEILKSIESLRLEAMRIAQANSGDRLRAIEEARVHYESLERGDISLPTSPYLWPTPGVVLISSPFGIRPDPLFGHTVFHRGIDIAGPSGSPIVAAASGVVIFSGSKDSYGNCVIISHPDGFETLYAHASENKVEIGDVVEAGDVIQLMGSTGYSTGNHLHFELITNGMLIDPLLVIAP
ncbi:MAG TPA: peptidoglycan DD-metalloendopeptidase family protein [Tissierellia bacterium]|nr:peptidoglycan DD-metalloendopeptidase family protein [Tissierellia bacterium]